MKPEQVGLSIRYGNLLASSVFFVGVQMALGFTLAVVCDPGLTYWIFHPLLPPT